jgi:hypothetical protein
MIASRRLVPDARSIVRFHLSDMALEFIKTLHRLLKGGSRILILHIQKGGGKWVLTQGFMRRWMLST